MACNKCQVRKVLKLFGFSLTKRPKHVWVTFQIFTLIYLHSATYVIVCVYHIHLGNKYMLEEQVSVMFF